MSSSSRSVAAKLGVRVAKVVADPEEDGDDNEDNEDKGKKRHGSKEQPVVDLRQVLEMSRALNFDDVPPPPDFMLSSLPESHLLMAFWYASEDVRQILSVDKWRKLLPKKRYPQFCFNRSKYCCYFSDPMACLEHRKRNNHTVDFGMPLNVILDQVEGKVREAKRNMLNRRGSPGRKYYKGSSERKSTSATRDSSLSAASRRSKPRKRDRSTDERSPGKSRAGSSSKELDKRSEKRISDFLRKERRRASGEYVSSSEMSEQVDEFAKRSRNASNSSKRSSRDRSERRTRERSSDYSFGIRRRRSTNSETSSTISSSSQSSCNDRRDRKTERRQKRDKTPYRQDRKIPMVSLRGLPRPVPSRQLNNDQKLNSSGGSSHTKPHDSKRSEPRIETKTDSKRADSLREKEAQKNKHNNTKTHVQVEEQPSSNRVKESDDSTKPNEDSTQLLQVDSEKEVQKKTTPSQSSNLLERTSVGDGLHLQYSSQNSVQSGNEEECIECLSPIEQSSSVKERSNFHGTNCSTKSQDSSQGLIINEDAITDIPCSENQNPKYLTTQEKPLKEIQGSQSQNEDQRRTSGSNLCQEPNHSKSSIECNNNKVNTKSEENITNAKAKAAFNPKESNKEPRQDESADTPTLMIGQSPDKAQIIDNQKYAPATQEKQTQHSSEHQLHSENQTKNRKEPEKPTESLEHTQTEPEEVSQAHLSIQEEWASSQSSAENIQIEPGNTKRNGVETTTTNSITEENQIEQNQTSVADQEHSKNQSGLSQTQTKEQSQSEVEPLEEQSFSAAKAVPTPRKDHVPDEVIQAGHAKDSKGDDSVNDQNTGIAKEKAVNKTPSYQALETAMEAIHNDETSNEEASRVSGSNESKSMSKLTAKFAKVGQENIRKAHKIVVSEDKKKLKKVESKKNAKNTKTSFADALAHIDKAGHTKKTKKKKSKNETEEKDPNNQQTPTESSKQTKKPPKQTSASDPCNNGRKRSTSESDGTMSSSQSTNPASTNVTEMPDSSTPKRSKMDDKIVLTSTDTSTTTKSETTTATAVTTTEKAVSVSPLPPKRAMVDNEQVKVTVTAVTPTTSTPLISSNEVSLSLKRAKIDGKEEVQTVPPSDHDRREDDEALSGESSISLTDDEEDEGSTMNLSKQLMCQVVEMEKEECVSNVRSARVLESVSDFCKVCNGILDPLKGHYVVDLKTREAIITCLDCGSINKALV